MTMISELWGRGTSAARESAILAFLAAGPIAGAKIVLSMEARGSGGPQRFLFDVEGFIENPAVWRSQARKKDEARENERRISIEAAAEERAAQNNKREDPR